MTYCTRRESSGLSAERERPHEQIALARRLRLTLGALVVVLPLLPIGCLVGADRQALWHVVHDLCVTNQRTSGNPAPCEEVHLARGEPDDGYAVLKDLLGRTQYLLIPTRRLDGIESPELLAADAPNYWRDARVARTYVFRALGTTLPRDAVGLAINSVSRRSQNQLHIHIDCVRRSVRDTLIRFRGELGETWKPFPVPIDGQAFLARRVDSPDLDSVDPFRLLAAGDAAARRDMAAETLVVVGATFEGPRPGFILLAQSAEPDRDDLGHGEDLLDHDCAVAKDVAGGAADKR